MRRILIMSVCGLAACGGGEAVTELPPNTEIVLPTGTASYAGRIGGTQTTNGSSGGVSYTEVTTTDAGITLDADFDTFTIDVVVTDPSRDTERSSATAGAAFNYIEERAFSGSASGTGTITPRGFSATFSGTMTQTSVDRTATLGPVVTITGSADGQVSGTDFETVTGTASLSFSNGGLASELFSDTDFTADKVK